MGLVYCGPYAEQVGYEHEGYAARILPGGQVTASWSAETEEFTAFVAACACGWTGNSYVPTDEGDAGAVAEWGREHLMPMVAVAAQDGWSAWLSRTAYRAAEIVTAVTAGEPELADAVMHALLADVTAWARVLEQLVEEAAAARGEW